MFYGEKVTRGGCSAENQKEFLGNVWGHAWEADEAPARAKAKGCPFAQGLPVIDGTEHRRRKGIFVSALEASLPKAFQFARLRINSFFDKLEARMATFASSPLSAAREMPSLTAEVDLVIADMICFMFGMHARKAGAEWCGSEAARRKLQNNARVHFQAFNGKKTGVPAAHASLFRFLKVAYVMPTAKQGEFVRNYIDAAASKGYYASTPRSAVLADM
jgi:hypothetical protein